VEGTGRRGREREAAAGGRKAKRSERERGEVRGWEQKSALGSRQAEEEERETGGSFLPFPSLCNKGSTSGFLGCLLPCHPSPLFKMARHGRLLILPCLPRHPLSFTLPGGQAPWWPAGRPVRQYYYGVRFIMACSHGTLNQDLRFAGPFSIEMRPFRGVQAWQRSENRGK
jgi:hypothetical protein